VRQRTEVLIRIAYSEALIPNVIKEIQMNSIVYIVGAVVIIFAILSFLGLR